MGKHKKDKRLGYVRAADLKRQYEQLRLDLIKQGLDSIAAGVGLCIRELEKETKNNEQDHHERSHVPSL